jgi:hypothetical protein
MAMSLIEDGQYDLVLIGKIKSAQVPTIFTKRFIKKMINSRCIVKLGNLFIMKGWCLLLLGNRKCFNRVSYQIKS